MAGKTFDYNLAVIGGGSAGLVCAYIAAAVKARVVLIERDRMGGECLNVGCVPSKALIRTASFLAQMHRAPEFGLRSASAEFEFSEVMERVRRVIARVAPHDSIERYSALGVDCVTGTATIVSPAVLEVDGRQIRARHIVVATGGRPRIPDIPGIGEIDVLTSDNIWDLRILPDRLVVIGGGPIGCELAQCFLRLGSRVSLVEGCERLLPREDVDVSQQVERRLLDEGMALYLGAKAQKIECAEGKNLLVVERSGRQDPIEFDRLLVATGREARTSGLGLEDVGVKLDTLGRIAVDRYMRTSVSGIYACGDVTGPYQFTHMAAHQAWYVAVNALFGRFRKFQVDYSVVPWCTFTEPEVARVGLNEQEAKEQGIPYEITCYGIDELDRAITDEEAHGFVKVLTVPGKDRVLGATIVGHHAGDLISEYVMAMKHGIGMNRLLGTIHIYPTMMEANKYAAGEWKKRHTAPWLLRLLERFHGWMR